MLLDSHSAAVRPMDAFDYDQLTASRGLFLQNRILQQIMLREIVYGLFHLFQI